MKLKEMVDRAERFGYTDDQLDHAAMLYQSLKRATEDALEFGSTLRRKGYLRSGNSLLKIAQRLEGVIGDLQEVEVVRQNESR